MGQPVIHFEIMGKDAEKLQSFYTTLFDWKIERSFIGEEMNYGAVEANGDGIGGGVAGNPRMDPHVTFYVAVDDVEDALSKAESLGGTRVMGPDKMDDPAMILGMFNDPEGNMVGLVHPLVDA